MNAIIGGNVEWLLASRAYVYLRKEQVMGSQFSVRHVVQIYCLNVIAPSSLVLCLPLHRRAPVGNRTQLTVCWQLAYVSVLGVCLQYHLQADEEAPYVSQGKVMPGKPYSGKAPKGKAAIETTLFDVIVADASVCDEEGMLPVLVSTSPRLKQSQQARIYALTYAWGFIADNIKTYLDMR